MAEEPPLDVPEVESQLSNQEAYRNRGESQCTVVWSEGQTFVVCFTCETSPGSAICYTCFRRGNHDGHIYDLIFAILVYVPLRVNLRTGICSQHMMVVKDLLLLLQSQVFLHQVLLVTTLLTLTKHD